MATQADASVVENIIGYSFRSRNHLVQALTAAGAEEDNHDGNRKLALLGGNLIRFSLSFVAFETIPSRSTPPC
jgi:dsRNA-specific ribonuclease